MKRFSDTARFEEPWYRALTPELKLAWEFLWARCDNAGVWWPDFPLAEFMIGCKVDWQKLRDLTGRVVVLDSGKWMIRGFVELQCGIRLSEDSRPHQAVIKLLEAHGVSLSDSLSIVYPLPLAEGTGTPKDKDKDTEKEKDRDKPPAREKDNRPTSPEALRIAAMFHRRPATPWSESEVRKFKALQKAGMLTDENLLVLEAFYKTEQGKGGDGWHRRQLVTFLNNFAGELDKANAAKGAQGNGPSVHSSADEHHERMMRQAAYAAQGEPPDPMANLTQEERHAVKMRQLDEIEERQRKGQW